MTLSVEELGIRVVLISCTWLLSIQTTQLSHFLHNQAEIVWIFCDWEIQVSTWGLELELSTPLLDQCVTIELQESHSIEIKDSDLLDLVSSWKIATIFQVLFTLNVFNLELCVLENY